MPELSQQKAEFLSTLYEKIAAGSLSWRVAGEGSFSTNLEDIRIDVDKKGDDEFIVWVFDREMNVVERIETPDVIGAPANGNVKNFAELIGLMYELLDKKYGGPRLEAVTDLLKKL